MSVVHKYLRKTKKFPHVWCSGCPDGIILGSVVRAVDKLQLSRDDVVLVSGIGCSSRAPVYVDFNTLHTTHGRAIPFATGVKLANPRLNVIIITGDGDAVAIGGNHFIHACTRNIDLTVIVFNNYNYGMTGGQRSPTTPLEGRTTTSPYGSMDPPIKICELAIGAGATFVARTTPYHVFHMDTVIRKGIQHKGISVIEVMTTCPTIYGRINRLGTASQMLFWFKENSMLLQKWQQLPPEEQAKAAEEKVIIGILKEELKPEYTEQYHHLVKSLQGERPLTVSH